jgi:hypothetical protein
MLNLLALEPKQKENVIALHELLWRQFNAEICNDDIEIFNERLASFELVKEFNVFSIKNIFKIRAAGADHYVLTVYAADVASGSNKIHIHAKCIAFVYTELQKQAGHILIRPERLSDKIVDLFTKRDLDFDSHPEFSRKYYLTTSNKSLTNRMLSYEFLDRIDHFKKIFLEIDDNRLLITYKIETPSDKIIPLIEFVSLADSLLQV